MHICVTFLQVGVSSISKARQITNTDPQLESILVGGKQYMPLNTPDLQSVFALLDFDAQSTVSDSSLNSGGIFVRSIFLPRHGLNGTLYRVGEFCLVINSVGEQAILKILDIFAVSINNTYHSFLKGCKYDVDSVNPITHPYSSNPVVADVQVHLICSASQIERKVMLYPHQTISNHFIVMDYNREEIPLFPVDILVPIFPEKNDMVKVRGDDDDDVWLAHVHNVDERSKTCRVHFYIRQDSSTNIYQKEHSRIETVHWDSIVGLMTGRWLSHTLYHADTCS